MLRQQLAILPCHRTLQLFGNFLCQHILHTADRAVKIEFAAVQRSSDHRTKPSIAERQCFLPLCGWFCIP